MPTIPQIVNGAKTTVKIASTVASIAPVAVPLVTRQTGKLSGKREERRRKREEKKRRKLEERTAAALDSAEKELEAERVEELWGEFGTRGRLEALGYLGGPGCFAILTFRDAAAEGSGTDEGLRGWFVGSGKVMARSVHAELSGEGNADVYADYKYGQPMSVLFFPCLPDDFEKISRVLRSSFPPAKAYG